MINKPLRFLLVLAMAWLGPRVLIRAAGADQLTIAWDQTDSGEAAVLTGGEFTLIATVGEHDAAEMTGGEFTAIYGFWAVLAPGCGCLADVNADGRLDGLDVQSFVGCMSAEGDYCTCADLDASRALDDSDIALFVDGLMNAGPCD